jgi:hypothetical protein
LVVLTAIRENDVRHYEQVSGAIFTLVAVAQLIRVLLGLPAQIGGFAIPIWGSVVAFLVAGGLALWALRASRSAR